MLLISATIECDSKFKLMFLPFAETHARECRFGDAQCEPFCHVPARSTSKRFPPRSRTRPAKPSINLPADYRRRCAPSVAVSFDLYGNRLALLDRLAGAASPFPSGLIDRSSVATDVPGGLVLPPVFVRPQMRLVSTSCYFRLERLACARACSSTRFSARQYRQRRTLELIARYGPAISGPTNGRRRSRLFVYRRREEISVDRQPLYYPLDIPNPRLLRVPLLQDLAGFVVFCSKISRACRPATRGYLKRLENEA